LNRVVTPESIIADATAALAVATFVLAGVTAWMARETHSTAKTATKALALEQMPILGVRDLRHRTTSPPNQFETLASVRFGIELFNAGRIPVKFTVKRIAVTLANQHFSTGQFASSGGRVLPGASTIFWQPATLTLNPPITAFPANGDIRFDYEYSDESGGQLQSLSETMDYTVARQLLCGSTTTRRLTSTDAHLPSPPAQRSSRRRSDVGRAAFRSATV
jgi:hypothetical protein